MKKYKEQMIQKKDFMQELKHYEEKGCELFLNGKPSSPRKIAATCMKEEKHTYMRDFISDNPGHIQRVNFIKVKSN